MDGWLVGRELYGKSPRLVGNLSNELLRSRQPYVMITCSWGAIINHHWQDKRRGAPRDNDKRFCLGYSCKA